MEINEIFDVLLHCMRYYDDPDFGNHFGFLEYYSITDISPKDLSRMARRLGNRSLSSRLLDFEAKNFWNSVRSYPDKIMYCDQIVNGKVFTNDDKLTIIEKIKSENYPLIDGIYYAASRIYAHYGADSISKEKTRNNLIKFYCESTGIELMNDFGLVEKAKVLTK